MPTHPVTPVRNPGHCSEFLRDPLTRKRFDFTVRSRLRAAFDISNSEGGHGHGTTWPGSQAADRGAGLGGAAGGFGFAAPSLSAVGIFTFIASRNNFPWPCVVTGNPDLTTMPNGIASVMDPHGVQWAPLMAGGLMAGLPLIFVFVLLRRHIVSGVARTGPAGQ